ncbi:MAG: fatty acyl-AMP ligase [Rhizomicrobium sp.]
MHLAIERSDVSERFLKPSAAAAAVPTPTDSGLERRFHFSSLAEALDYAATGKSGMNFYSDRLDLKRAVSYHDIREGALHLAGVLRQGGLQRGERVALVADTDPDFVIAFAACQYGGLIPAPMPLPSAFGGREGYIAQIRHMLKCAHATAAIAPDWVMPYLQEAADGLRLKLVGTAAELAALPSGRFEPVKPDAHELSYLQFSSGSTRSPAGIAVTHSALMANAAAIAHDCLDVRDGDRAVSWLPFYHDMGLVGFLLATIVSQLSVDFLATRDFARRPLSWLRLMAMNGGTISYSSSFGYDLCAKRASSGAAPDFDLSRWRVAGIGGDMVRPAVLDHFVEIFAPVGFRREALVPSYGLAEATLAVSFNPLERGLRVDHIDNDKLERERIAVPVAADADDTIRTRDFVVCGRVIPGHTVEIRDDDGRRLTERDVGHVWLRGPSLMTGYDSRPEETAKIMDAAGWLDTGDLGYFAEGELVITGRYKDIIIINGRNLWPQDIEYTIESTEGLRSGDAAAFSVENPADGEEKVVVLVQCRQSDPVARDALVHTVTASLRKGHGVSADVVLVPKNALPMTSSGKLRRRSARASYLAGEYRLDANT